MTQPLQPARRATVDDLPQLVALWREKRLPWELLEKRVQDHQIILSAGGELLGAIGWETGSNDARLHTEVFAHDAQADELRVQLWERLRVLAKNHGVARVWTQLDTPFWLQNGFAKPTPEQSAKLPPDWAGDAQPWQVLQLREEAAVQGLTLDQHLALFKEASRAERESLQQKARVMRFIALAAAVALAAVVGYWAFSFFRLQSRRRRR